jgi:hypothetical protein
MSVQKYRKKPVVIEALQFDGTDEASEAIRAWAGKDAAVVDTDHIAHLWDYGAGCYILPSGKMIHAPYKVRHLIIMTLEGEMLAAPGWWIIKGIQGEFYPCQPDIFAETYDAVNVDG